MMIKSSRHRFAAILLFSIGFGRALLAQDASRILKLCDQDRLSLPEASWLALSSSGLVAPEATGADSLAKLRELGWLKRAARADAEYSPITVAEFSFLAMKASKMRGGLGYSLFPSPRYAFRELAYRGVLPAGTEPRHNLDGTLAVRLVAKVDELRGGGK